LLLGACLWLLSRIIAEVINPGGCACWTGNPFPDAGAADFLAGYNLKLKAGLC